MNRSYARPGRKALTPHQRISKWIRDGKIAESPDGCWIWTGSRNRGGYGCVGMSDKAVGGDGSGKYRATVHRFVYEHHLGPIPAGLDLDHLCRVRACCNPDHLEPVTRSENLRRAVGIGIQWSRRTHCKNGHEYTPENTRRAGNARICVTCAREKSRRHRRRYIDRESA